VQLIGGCIACETVERLIWHVGDAGLRVALPYRHQSAPWVGENLETIHFNVHYDRDLNFGTLWIYMLVPFPFAVATRHVKRLEL
jgi:hypothetical protein